MRRVRSLVAAISLALAMSLPGPANAQEVTDAHLQAAWNAIRAVGADVDFDLAIPDIAQQVQAILLDARPDLFREIGPVVNEVAFELIARRLDLNNDAARVWALTFTEQELVEITDFYNSPTGKKFIELFDPLVQQTLQVFENWAERIFVEMLERAQLKFAQDGIAF